MGVTIIAIADRHDHRELVSELSAASWDQAPRTDGSDPFAASNR